jgi:hypothetical protein
MDDGADVVEAVFSEQGEGGGVVLGVEGGGELAGDCCSGVRHLGLTPVFILEL